MGTKARLKVIQIVNPNVILGPDLLVSPKTIIILTFLKVKLPYTIKVQNHRKNVHRLKSNQSRLREVLLRKTPQKVQIHPNLVAGIVEDQAVEALT
jgi:hypothetical protein